MSKEIYKEYLCEWVDAVTHDERKNVNENYLFRDEKIAIGFELFFLGGVYDLFKRAPKTQMINGHEVVAPRYDMPTNKDELIFTLSSLELCGFDGVAWDCLDHHQKKAILKYGWFDNSDDAEDYANAHRENKND